MTFTPKLRDSNIELYRIIVMFFIVAHHYVINSDLRYLIYDNPYSFQSILFQFLGMWGKVGTDCFVLITGYFMCKSNITIRKFLKLILEVLFYNIIIYSFFVLIGYTSFSAKEFLLATLPIKSISNDFTSCYIVFYLFIPYLNILIRGLTKKQHCLLIILTVSIFSIINYLPKFIVNSNDSIWFCVLYIIASYIRIHGMPYKVSFRTQSIITTLSVLLCFASVLFTAFLSKKLGVNLFFAFVNWPSAPLALITSVMLFELFRNLKIQYNSIINTISASMFGVLLIHANSNTMRQWLWNDTIRTAEHYNSIQYAFVCVLTVFICCIIIDQIRIHTVERVTFKYIDTILLN